MRKQRAAEKAIVDAALDWTPCNNLALRQAARHVSQIYDRHMAEIGLRGTQYSILSKLARLGPMPLGKLAETMVMERTALSRAVRPLERDGLISVGAGANGRTRSVALTAAGQVKFKTAQAQWRRAQKEFEAAFGADQAESLRSTLKRVIAAT
ncbi:MAG: MarR family winged helix-turn-helix transcriptional regulator [Pseudolabrys sp.]